MKRTINGKTFPILMLLISMGVQACSTGTSGLEPYLRKKVTWKLTSLDKEVPVNIYFLGGDTGPDGSEVIVYMKNGAWDRIGQETDFSILHDYIQKKFIVITVDFGTDKQAVSPGFDKDLYELFKAVYGFRTASLLEGLGIKPREYRCFFLPEGYRVATNLVYWEIDKHAAFGTLDYIMKSYNEDIVPKLPGLKPVSRPEDMVDRKGNPFDFTIKMDIVYPSQPRKKVPAMIFSAWLAPRNPNGEPISYLPHFAGFTTRGYAYIVMGHCFNPNVQHYFHYLKFTLDQWNGLACYTAAMRYINANAEKYGINTQFIGMAGHSKGEYAITRLSDPHHKGGKELSRFEGFPEGSPEPQPWLGYPSNIAAGYQSMGMGLFEPQFITADYVPTIVACGENERDEISKMAHPAFVKRLEELDVNYINLFMQGLGHEMPYGYDERMGVDRYRLVHDFFDRYLRVEDKLPPALLIAFPHNNQDDVSPDSPIILDFAPIIEASGILQGKEIRVLSIPSRNEVSGTWKASHGGTRFTFTPEHTLEKDRSYMIVISGKLKDKHGTPMGQGITIKFRVTAQTGIQRENVRISSRAPGTEYPEWSQENLDVAVFRNGDLIPVASSDEEWVKAGREGKPACCYYEKNPENGKKYGRLYNWYAVHDPRGLAPEGWHVANDTEWRQTTDFLGGEDAAGTRMKSSTGWKGEGNGINDSQFNGLPAGCRDLNGKFSGLGERAFWWTTTEYDNTLAWYRCIDTSPYYVYRTNYYKQNGLSVRCIRDKKPSL
jgi:uncharacterized protein (TIGR02145 family)